VIGKRHGSTGAFGVVTMADNLAGKTDQGVSSKVSARSPKPLAAILGRLKLHYPMQAMTTDQERLFWADYLADLKDWPIQTVEQACSRWRQSAERFFPTPGQIAEICRKIVTDLSAERERAERAKRIPPPKPTPEEKAKVAEIMADFRAKLVAKGIRP